MQDLNKEFKPLLVVYQQQGCCFVITLIVKIAGSMGIRQLTKNFPDISLLNIYVSVIYPGTSPKDMEI